MARTPRAPASCTSRTSRLMFKNTGFLDLKSVTSYWNHLYPDAFITPR